MFTTAFIYPDWSFVVIIVNTSLHVQVFPVNASAHVQVFPVNASVHVQVFPVHTFVHVLVFTITSLLFTRNCVYNLYYSMAM